MTFDLRSIFFAHSIVNLLVLVVAFVIWLKNRKKIQGPFFWLLGLIAAAGGEGLLIFRNTGPGWVPVIFGNGLLILGYLLLYLGLSDFTGTKRCLLPNLVLYALFLAGLIFFFLIRPILVVRMYLFSVTAMILALECFWVLYHSPETRYRNSSRLVSLIFLAYALVYVFRILYLALLRPPVETIQIHSAPEAVVLILSQVLILAMGMGLIIIINQRLLLEVEAVGEKNRILLHELHHRVKNNLQMIISLVRLQISRQQDEAIKEPLRLVQNRIFSMAMVHEQLYIHDAGTPVDLEEYTRNVLHGLCASYHHDCKNMSLEVVTESTSLEISRLVPYGLVLNEMVTNALKHAYPTDSEPGIIKIRLESKEQDYILTVEDQGKGLPEGFNPEESRSLGMQILLSLSSQLHGTLLFSSGKGTRFQLVFPVDSL